MLITAVASVHARNAGSTRTANATVHALFNLE
jgi:hypothetical protein